MWRALARRQGLSDPALDRLLISIPAPDLARAEERARFWPSAPPSAGAVADTPALIEPDAKSTTLPAPTDEPLPAPAAPKTPAPEDEHTPSAPQDP